MKVKYYIKKVDGLVLPTRANETDAGYDVIATSGPNIVGKPIQNPNPSPEAEDLDAPKEYYYIDYIEYKTNLYITPDSEFDVTAPNVMLNFHTDLRPRSSISKYNLVLANSVGLIDQAYKNQVLCRFKYIWQPEDYAPIFLVAGSERVSRGLQLHARPNLSKIYQMGDKIAQLVVSQTHDIEFIPVDELPGVDRGGGFGSTGK